MNKILLMWIGAVLFLSCESKEEKKLPPPNFVWLISEDNSKHYLKLFDENGIATPNIEKLAESGLTYTRAFSNAPVCSAARTTLITSCYGPRIGTQFHRKSQIVPMPDGLEMFPAYLRKAGYYTANNSKTDYNAQKGEGVWDESSKKAHWKNRKSDQPFFYKTTYTESHESRLHFDEEFMSTYKPTIHPDSVFVNPNHPDTELFRFTNSFYRDRMLLNDEFVGKAIKQLEEENLLENTFVFYFGDHGGVLPGSKGYLYETGIHVPLVVRIPENYKHLLAKEPGDIVEDFVSFIDFGPTLLKLAGIEAPEGIDGKPFLGNPSAGEKVTFGYADRFDEKYDLVRSVRKGKFKYMRNYQPFNPDGLHNFYRYKALAYEEWRTLYKEGKLNDTQKHFFEPREPEELFDVEADPYEINNLANNSEYKGQLVDLRNTLTEWVKGMPDLSFYPESELIKEAFQRPVSFGQSHKFDISELIDISNLSLLPFEDARADLKLTLESNDPFEKYWGLIVCSSFGSEASEFYALVKSLGEDDHLLVRARAAEFLALTGQVHPKQVINGVLKSTKNDIEALLVLNTVVLLMDGTYQYKFDISRDMIDKKVMERDWIQRRIEYVEERQADLQKS